jgi:acyl-CoA synthetase (AMP-forming)/AMP-acid ligase II
LPPSTVAESYNASTLLDLNVAASRGELRAFCSEWLHRYQIPQLIEFVDDLPKAVIGKIQRSKLRAG